MKKRLFFSALAILALPSLTACSSTEGAQDLAYEAPAMFQNKVDPSDAALRQAIADYLAGGAGPANSQYQYSRIDLNGDGLREGLVLFNLPHSHWCGWNGCKMAVFEAGDNRFSLLSETDRIRGPIVVGDSTTKGWGDIGVRMTGMDQHDYNVLLKYDGTGYPFDPAGQETMPYALAALGGTRLFP